MIHPTYNEAKFKKHNVEYPSMAPLMDKVFGPNPTIKNMKILFDHEAIWDLWNASHGFR